MMLKETIFNKYETELSAVSMGTLDAGTLAFTGFRWRQNYFKSGHAVLNWFL